jgi:hypothetical protein
MSIPKAPSSEEKVLSFLLGVLSEEDVNLVAAEEELNRHLAIVEHHNKRVLALRETLSALGQDPDRLGGLGEL